MDIIKTFIIILLLSVPCFADQITYVCPTNNTGTAKDPAKQIYTDLGVRPTNRVIFYGDGKAVVTLFVTTDEVKVLRDSGKIFEVVNLNTVNAGFPNTIEKAGFSPTTYSQTLTSVKVAK